MSRKIRKDIFGFWIFFALLVLKPAPIYPFVSLIKAAMSITQSITGLGALAMKWKQKTKSFQATIAAIGVLPSAAISLYRQYGPVQDFNQFLSGEMMNYEMDGLSLESPARTLDDGRVIPAVPRDSVEVFPRTEYGGFFYDYFENTFTSLDLTVDNQTTSIDQDTWEHMKIKYHPISEAGPIVKLHRENSEELSKFEMQKMYMLMVSGFVTSTGADMNSAMGHAASFYSPIIKDQMKQLLKAMPIYNLYMGFIQNSFGYTNLDQAF